jgi:RNA polymerase sigma-70 factor (ECF subfamily)
METFEDFYSKTKKGFYNYILSFTQDKDIADDIFQEAYYKLIKKYKNDFSVNLLYTIGKNLYFDEYNRNKQHINIDLVEPVYSKKNSDDNLELEKVLNLLDDDEKKLFIMAVADDLSYDEISRLTGISVSNIKVKIHRARKKINSTLNGGNR